MGRVGLYKILFHFEALLHNNILCKKNLYCAIYCTTLPLIAPPRPVLRYFEGVFCEVVFLFFRSRISDGSRCWKKNPFSTRKKGIIAHYCAIPPSQPPFIAYNIAQYIFPTTPFIAIKYWQYAISCKGQSECSVSQASFSQKSTYTSIRCFSCTVGIGRGLWVNPSVWSTVQVRSKYLSASFHPHNKGSNFYRLSQRNLRSTVQGLRLYIR